jgi:3'-5' exoribonuclease
MRYIKDLKENEHLIEHYFCKQKESLKTRSGKTYYSLRLVDKTGMISAKVWELHNDIQSFEEGDMIKIDGTVLTYQNELQLKVNKARRSLEGEYDPMEYIQTTEKDINQLQEQASALIASVENPFLRALLENILKKNNEVSKLFKSHSAAKHMHHSYMGGLLEHTVSVAQICDFMSGRYKYVNRDLLITSALLHDVGKIYELSRLPENDYTDDGQMLGHLFIGAEMVALEARNIDGFPHELESLLKHSILSHHGDLEFGSPKLPNTMEAFLLHCADNMDAKLKTYEETIDKDSTAGNWAGYQRMLNRWVRKSGLNE